jgi:hypothetical protein
MSIVKIDNLFSLEQMSIINNAISIPSEGIDSTLGRSCIWDIKHSFNQDIKDTLENIVKNITGAPLAMDHALYVEYSAKYGQPNLPPHFDGDTNDLIINTQLESNTSWDIGLNLETYTLKDNSAVIFNGNTEIHWRPHKEFKEGEYVRMLFIRFYNTENRSDYSYLPNHPSDPVFDKARAFRDSLKFGAK